MYGVELGGEGLPVAGTIHEMISLGGQDPSAVALLSVEGGELSYRELRDQIAYTVGGLGAHGLTPRDRVATLVPNGPVMATVLVSVASGFACAPLNPGLRKAELDRCLSEIKPRCLLVPSGTGGDAVEVAAERGVEVLEVKPTGAGAGAFRIEGIGEAPRPGPVWAGGDDVVLLMQTSGTTAKPKLVALTNAIVAHSVTVIGERLELTKADRGINILPLFHVHGQITILASLFAGGSVVCTPGFDPERFLGWLAKFKPTWYTAVPTMHRAILDCMCAGKGGAPPGRLRFVRSASSALPLRLFHELEDALGVPVVEAYGMTEASHGISSNLLPPGLRKAGSVGIPFRGEEVKIVGEAGRRLGVGETGEILIRGKNVITGYAEDPETNARSFVDGWLRTGDLGYVDAEGYLFIVGRVKDVINRGGEKISPREVEEALLDTDAVSQAIVFPVPHPTLGEDVAAAVVARRGHRVEEDALRAGLMEMVAQHKVPQRIFIVDEIPKSPTGKPQRWEMARMLGISPAGGGGKGGRAPARQPTATEEKVLRIWMEVLRRDDVGLDERFLEAGGDSLRVTQVSSRLKAVFGVELDLGSLFDAETVQEQARLVEFRLSDRASKNKKES